MLPLIKNSISSLSPSINRGWLAGWLWGAGGLVVGSVRTEAGRHCGTCPLAAHTGLSGGTAVTPPLTLGAYAGLADLGVSPPAWRTTRQQYRPGRAGRPVSGGSQCYYYAGYHVPLCHTVGSARVSQRTAVCLCWASPVLLREDRGLLAPSLPSAHAVPLTFLSSHWCLSALPLGFPPVIGEGPAGLFSLVSPGCAMDALAVYPESL